MPPLSVLLWIPAAAGVLALAAPRRLAPRVVLLGALATLALAILALVDFNQGAGPQHVTDVDWIPGIGVHYKLALTGLNVFLVLTTSVLFAAATLAAGFREWPRSKLFYLMLALAESGVLGAFLVQDIVLFVLFFDFMLVPFYFIVGIWGPDGLRVPATTKMLIYTFTGSLLMLAAAIAAGVLAAAGTPGAPVDFSYTAIAHGALSAKEQDWIFAAFALAFAIKMPLMPFQGWMPDAYRAMPYPALAVFASLLSKVAAYGFLAIALPLFPHAAANYQGVMLGLALASILYGSAMAFTQSNLRLVIGYSSVAQLGFITLGIFALRSEGAQGALLQMVNHAVVTAPAFFIIALLAARAGSDDLRRMGGIALRAPVLATIFVIISFAVLAMPGSSNFIGEFMILLGVFQAQMPVAIIAFLGVVAASVYMLRAFIRAMHNRVSPEVGSRDQHEIGVRDGLVLAPLVLVILGLAFYPQIVLKQSSSVTKASVAAAHAISLGEALPPGLTRADRGWFSYAPANGSTSGAAATTAGTSGGTAR